MEKTTMGNSKLDENQQAIPKMEKYKLKTEYDKVLLRRSKDSKRERREEEGFVLVDSPPAFSQNEKKKWVKFEFRNGQLEGWEKLCVEAYCVGWLAFYDKQNYPEGHKIYFKWEDIQTIKSEGKDEPQAGGSTVTVYIDPGPEEIQSAAPLSDPPKPPPPPMS